MLSTLIRAPSRLMPAKLEQAVQGHRCLCDALLLVEEIGTLAVGGMKNRLTSDDNFVALHHPKKTHAATGSSLLFLTAEPAMLGGAHLLHGVPTALGQGFES
jgi:hypothetical protein